MPPESEQEQDPTDSNIRILSDVLAIREDSERQFDELMQRIQARAQHPVPEEQASAFKAMYMEGFTDGFVKGGTHAQQRCLQEIERRAAAIVRDLTAILRSTPTPTKKEQADQ